jgi:cob(I)alamin adenosyltransferase
MKIYTKTGDKGLTSNVLGNRVSKADFIMELQGGIDEINANTGYLRSMVQEMKNEEAKRYIDDALRDVQYDLFKLGVEVSSQFTMPYVKTEHVEFLEKNIDKMTSELEQLKNFIYYSGASQSTHAHIIRSITRRVERIFVRMLEGRDYPECYQYVNRLSDFYYTLARYINKVEGQGEEVMKMR